MNKFSVVFTIYMKQQGYPW